MILVGPELTFIWGPGLKKKDISGQILGPYSHSLTVVIKWINFFSDSSDLIFEIAAIYFERHTIHLLSLAKCFNLIFITIIFDDERPQYFLFLNEHRRLAKTDVCVGNMF